MKISWSANNPGRWFLGCEDGRVWFHSKHFFFFTFYFSRFNFGSEFVLLKHVECKFFRWCELDYTEHAIIAISGLKKRIKKHDEKKKKIRRKYRLLLIIVILSWIYREFFM